MKRKPGKHAKPGEMKARILDLVISGCKGRLELKSELCSIVSTKDVDYHLARKGGLVTEGILSERKGLLNLNLADFSNAARALNYLIRIPEYEIALDSAFIQCLFSGFERLFGWITGFGLAIIAAISATAVLLLTRKLWLIKLSDWLTSRVQ